MSNVQYCGIQKRYTPCVTSKLLQATLSTVFLLAVVIVPTIAAISFFIN